MKKSCAILLAGLLIAVFAAPASAWEFNLAGRWLWGYDYIDQAGKAGFFGAYDVAGPGLIGGASAHFATANGWVGARTINAGVAAVQYGVVTGSNASLQWMRTELEPEFKINEAVRLRGLYQIGAGALSQYGLYANSSTFGAYNPIATGQWTQFWFTAQTPWGILVAGKRPFAFGMGAQYDGTSASSEALGVVAPYGPLRVGVVVYPWRQQTWVNSLNTRNIISSTLVAGPTAIQAYRTWDNDAKRQLQPGAFVTFSAGDLDMGAVYEWFTIHNGPAGAITNTNALNANTYDEVLEDGSAYIKYNNGRFFLNAEMGWLRGQLNKSPAQIPLVAVDPGDGGGSFYAPQYNEVFKYMAEAGLMAGPTKVSFLYSWVPGPDRRHGIWIDRQTWENVAAGSFLGNAQPFLPYSLLMSYQYGAGLNAVNRNGEGYMTDAQSLGARMDYAVAANLNFFGSFFWANRLSRGWPWGALTLNQDGNGGFNVLLRGQQTAAPQNTFVGGAPNITEDNLGYEIGAGLDWKLLEGLTCRLRGAYWQPGDWFKFACVDKAVITTAAAATIAPTAADGPFGWGINPNRAIDPIWGFQGIMMVDF